MKESRINECGVLLDAESVTLIEKPGVFIKATIGLHIGRYYYGYSIMLKDQVSASPCSLRGQSKSDYKSAVRAVIEILCHHRLIGQELRSELYEKHAEYSQLNLF